MNLVLFVLFAIINSVLCIDKNIYNQNVNHPPATDNYDPIPVSIIYGDDVIDGKSNMKEEAPMTTKPTDVNTVSEINKSDSRLDNIQERSKPRALDEYQIPVTVVFDSVPEIRQTSQLSPTGSPKKRLRPSRRPQNKSEKEAKEDVIKESVQPTTSTIAPGIETRSQKVGSVRPQSPRVDLVNLQTNKAGSTKLQPTNVKSVESRPQNAEITNPQSKSVEKVKLQPRKINISNPIKVIESSNLVTTPKGGQRKRERDPVVRIIDSQNYVFAHNGNFHYSYEGADGTKAFSEGQLKTIKEDAGESVSGGFSYTDKEGNDFSLSYTADENGYRPVGAHLPTPPPIPPEIARALAYLATATTPEPVTKPSANKT